MGHLSAALDQRGRDQLSEDNSGNSAAGMDRHVSRRISSKETLRLIAIGAAALVAALLFFSEVATRSTYSVITNRLTVATVKPGVFRDYIPVSGNVIPRNSVFLDAIDGGQVTEIYVEEGEYVEIGMPLVKLKNTALRLEVIGREAQLAEQINNLSLTQLSFEQNKLQHRKALIETNYRMTLLDSQISRYRKLIGSGGATREQLEDAGTEYDYHAAMRDAVAESQRVDELSQGKQIETLEMVVKSLTENISIARENLENLTLRAPMSGQLTSLQADIGESKARGQRIGKIDEIDSFKASAFIDEFYLSRVVVGQQAKTELAGMEHSLTISKVYPEVRNRQFEIDFQFDQQPQNIRRGQTIQLDLEIGSPIEILTLSNGEFFDESGGAWVYVVDEKQQLAERREVKLGRRNPDSIEILSGLEAGERVVVSSYANFANVERLLLRAED